MTRFSRASVGNGGATLYQRVTWPTDGGNTANTITTDGKEYDMDSLSDAAKSQLTNILVTDQEIVRLQ